MGRAKGLHGRTMVNWPRPMWGSGVFGVFMGFLAVFTSAMPVPVIIFPDLNASTPRTP